MSTVLTKRALTLLALAILVPPMAEPQCSVVPNTGTPIFPSFNAGRCATEGGYCELVGKDGSQPKGKCATTGKPPKWGCQCLMNGNPTPYLVLNPGTLSTFNSPQGFQTAIIGLISVNGFSGNVAATCSVSGTAPGAAPPSCSLTPSSVTLGSLGGIMTLSVPIKGLAPGNYSASVIANSAGGGDRASLPLTISGP
jgi:hypothetical protein